MYQVSHNVGPSDWLLRFLTMNMCVFYKTFIHAETKLLLILLMKYVYIFVTNKRLIKYFINQQSNHKQTSTMFCYVIQKIIAHHGAHLTFFPIKTGNHENRNIYDMLISGIIVSQLVAKCSNTIYQVKCDLN